MKLLNPLPSKLKPPIVMFRERSVSDGTVVEMTDDFLLLLRQRVLYPIIGEIACNYPLDAFPTDHFRELLQAITSYTSIRALVLADPSNNDKRLYPQDPTTVERVLRDMQVELKLKLQVFASDSKAPHVIMTQGKHLTEIEARLEAEIKKLITHAKGGKNRG